MPFLSPPDAGLRIAVFAAEIFLAGTLAYWLKTGGNEKNESWRFLLSIIAYGGLTALIAAFVEIRYSFDIPYLERTAPELVSRYGVWYQVLNNFSASMIEELAKYMVAVFTVINTRHFHKMSDAIVYLVLIGLGFSLVEDAIFLLDPLTDAPYRLLSFYLHSGTSAIIGYSLGRFKFGKAGYGELARGVLAAILLHFGYNLSAHLNNSDLAFWLTVAIILYISLQVFILFQRALSEEQELEMLSAPVKKRPPVKLLNLD